MNAYINKDNIPIGTLRLYANSIELMGSRTDYDGGNSDTGMHELPHEESNAIEVPF